jgi:hypothetical protein
MTLGLEEDDIDRRVGRKSCLPLENFVLNQEAAQEECLDIGRWQRSGPAMAKKVFWIFQSIFDFDFDDLLLAEGLVNPKVLAKKLNWF